MKKLPSIKCSNVPSGELVITVSAHLGGHRASYLSFFGRIFESRNIVSVPMNGRFYILTCANPVFFLLIEDHLILYLISSIIRSLRGKRTVGLLFRGMEVSRRATLRHRAKAFVLAALKLIPTVKTLSIIPFTANSEIQRYADDWITDPQFWDLETIPQGSLEFSSALRAIAGDRKIIVALGVLNRQKGFEFFYDCLCKWGADGSDWLFVAAGKVDQESALTAENFERCGGKLYDRYITDEELFALYGIADLVWAVYAPDYNQSSGVFGRAFQFSVTAIVRTNSVSAFYGAEIGADMILLDYGEPEQLGRHLASIKKRKLTNTNQISLMREKNVETILKSLGVSDK